MKERRKQPVGNSASEKTSLWASYSQAVEAYHTAGFDFVVAELDTAITFCKLALVTRTACNADRNRNHAILARDAALRTMGQIRLTESDEHEIAERLERLESLLRRVEGNEAGKAANGGERAFLHARKVISLKTRNGY